MNHDPISALSKLMKLWPKQSEGWKEEVISRISSFVTEDVGETDLSIRPYGEFCKFSRPVIADGVAKIIVYDTKFAGDPGNLAVMVQELDGRWKLKMFVELCLVCFGCSLVADDIPCEYCGATGWGEWKVWRERFGVRW